MSANLTELVQAAQATTDDVVLSRRVNRGTPRSTLLDIINGKSALSDVPEPPSAEARKKLPLAVNAMWDRVRYSVAGCPLETRSIYACFTCPDIQSAACTSHNGELLSLEISPPTKAEQQKEKQMSEETFPIRTEAEWKAVIAEAKALDAKPQKEALRAVRGDLRGACAARHGISTSDFLTQTGTDDKKIALIVKLDTEAGNFEGGAEAPAEKPAAAKAGKKASASALLAAAQAKAKSKAGKTASADAVTKDEPEPAAPADEDSLKALGQIRAEIANLTAEVAALDSGISSSVGEVAGSVTSLELKLNVVLRLLRGLVVGEEEGNTKELLEALDDAALEELTETACGLEAVSD